MADGIDWKWFGSMNPAGWFKKQILEGTAIGEAIDKIPLDGPVSKEMFNDFCDVFYKICGDNPLATATRLLAIKRPDVFVCIDSKNKQNLCRALNINEKELTLRNYWNVLHKRIINSEWYLDNRRVSGLELDAKCNQVALLDCFFYDYVSEED
mgnify:CR=1 FL=1